MIPRMDRKQFAYLIYPIILEMIVPSACWGAYEVEQINENITVHQISNERYTLIMNENNHDYNDKTPLVRINNVKSVTFNQFVGTSSFRYSIEAEDEKSNSFILYANQSFDFETQERKYLMSLNMDSDFVIFTLDINNIDDEPPSMYCPRCLLDQYEIYDKFNSSCYCTVSDSDGWLSLMSFKILDGGYNESTLFELAYPVEPLNSTKEADISLFPNKMMIYEIVPYYIFNIQAKDSAFHSTIPENTEVIAVVNNMIVQKSV